MERQREGRDTAGRLPLPEVQSQVHKKITPKKEQGMKKLFDRYSAVVFFDTETTGLNADTCQIIELAAIRVEKGEDGKFRKAEADMFVRLPKGQKIPEKIVELTGITDETLEAEGITEAEAAAVFDSMINPYAGPVLLVAHNAQFDLLFVREMLKRHYRLWDGELVLVDYLDSLTVYKDRRAYPHKLANAITAYKLDGKVQNTHRAIDDVKSLCLVVIEMGRERDDLLTYVNTFGYNPKYGVSGRRIDGVKYRPQRFNTFMQSPKFTLPARARRNDE
jgi:DNA polymerase-3 subunit epsilon